MTVPGKCCLCIKLSNGGIVLGSIGAFTSLVLVIVIGGVVLNYDNYVLQSYEKGQNDSDSYKLAQFLESYKNIVVSLALIYISLQVINFVASLSLVCGTIHKRPKLMFAWLSSEALIIIFWILGSVLTYDYYMVLYAVLYSYFWLCVYSLYKETKLEVYQQSLHYGIQAV